MSEDELEFKEDQYCTFYLGNDFFGIDVLKVQEVVRYQDLTIIPLVGDSVKGLMNLRGQVVMSVDMRKCLGLEPFSDEDRPFNLVVHDEEHSVGFMVDRVGDVLELSKFAMEHVPENVDIRTRKYLDGVFKLKDKFMMVLDIAKLINSLHSLEKDKQGSMSAASL